MGDCHYYEITKKWVSLQKSALKIAKGNPELVLRVHYEELLVNKKGVIKTVYNFLGVRRFGGIKRQASVIVMPPVEYILSDAKKGRETIKAVGLSYQFKNLRRGSSFAAVQFQKWRDPKTGLTADEPQIIESLAHEVMEELGYGTSEVGVNSESYVFSKEEVESFANLNSLGIQKMKDDLKVENPGDFERRKFQAQALSFDLVLKGDWDDHLKKSTIEEKGDRMFVQESFLSDRLELGLPTTGQFPSGRKFQICAGTKRGYYPNDHEKVNQDAYICNAKATLSGRHMSWFSVLDGHGHDGHKCSQYVSDNIQSRFSDALSTLGNTKSALISAHLLLHDCATRIENINTNLSGTTATTLIFDGETVYVSSLGDSVCMLGSYSCCRFKSPEHTLLSKTELERIKRSGGKVMSINQRDGIEPIHENWSRTGDPPRIWADKENSVPGTNFTRSIGDTVAHSVGVTARPEIVEIKITSADRVFIVASDGITECKFAPLLF